MELAVLIAICLFGQGLYEGSEMVLVSADRYRLKERALRGGSGAKLALCTGSTPPGSPWGSSPP